MYEVGVGGAFHATHRLEGIVGDDGPRHSHGYRVEVVVRGESISEDGMLLDLDRLNAALSECLGELDSTDLDELAPFAGQETTVERVAGHIWEGIRDSLDGEEGLSSLRVTVFESPDAWAAIDRSLD
jgi:6-pyruvoyltetrahydropterin/6-carboxytetrahydropterin synthase